MKLRQKKSSAAVQIVFKGDSIKFVTEGGKRIMRGSYTVDPSNAPKTMDITLDSGRGKVVTLVIYELEGDTLQLCHYLGAKAGNQRPNAFTVDKQAVLGVLEREKN